MCCLSTCVVHVLCLLCLLCLWGVVQIGLDDSLVTLNTILGSRFCAPIREEVESWQRRLILLSDTLDEWLNCQKQWMYLEV